MTIPYDHNTMPVRIFSARPKVKNVQFRCNRVRELADAIRVPLPRSPNLSFLEKGYFLDAVNRVNAPLRCRRVHARSALNRLVSPDNSVAQRDRPIQRGLRVNDYDTASRISSKRPRHWRRIMSFISLIYYLNTMYLRLFINVGLIFISWVDKHDDGACCS